MFTFVFVINIKIRKMKKSELFSVLGLCVKNIYFVYDYITLTGYVFPNVDQLTIASRYVDFNQQCLLQQ